MERAIAAISRSDSFRPQARAAAWQAALISAVLEAMANPRQLDMELVEAYLARRALDYLVGFTLSPVLWRKLPGARSAGRVGGRART